MWSSIPAQLTKLFLSLLLRYSSESSPDSGPSFLTRPLLGMIWFCGQPVSRFAALIKGPVLRRDAVNSFCKNSLKLLDALGKIVHIKIKTATKLIVNVNCLTLTCLTVVITDFFFFFSFIGLCKYFIKVVIFTTFMISPPLWVTWTTTSLQILYSYQIPLRAKRTSIRR